MFDNLRRGLAQILVPKQVPSNLGMAFLNPISSGGTPPRLGTRELLMAYNEMPWLRAIVKKVGQAVGTVEWKIFVATNAGSDRAIRNFKAQRSDTYHRRRLLSSLQKQNNLKEIEAHPLLDMLNFGNDVLLGNASFQLTQNYLDLVGESFWILERNALGMPIAYWPVPPDWVRQFPVPGKPFFLIKVGALEEEIPMSEVIWFLDPDPSNPYGRGIGTAKALGDELETDEYASKHLKNFFYNRARPDIIISGDNISPGDTARMEEKWLQKHQSFWNSFKPQFLSRKVDITQLGQTFEHMQMIDIRKYERDTIIQVYGVPPEKFGIVNESKRSTIAAADFFWTKDVLEPRLEDLRIVLQERLVPMFDDRIILDYESPIVQDQEHRLAVMSKFTWAFSMNEIRAEAQADDLGPDGEIYQQPGNSKPVDIQTLLDMIEADDPFNPPEMQLAQMNNEARQNQSNNNNSDQGKSGVELLEKLSDQMEDRSDDIKKTIKNSMMLQKV